MWCRLPILASSINIRFVIGRDQRCKLEQIRSLVDPNLANVVALASSLLGFSLAPD